VAQAQASSLEGVTLRVLDVGCGPKPYYPFSLRAATDYVGVDIAGSPAAELHGSVEALPVGDATFDVVLCTQVLSTATTRSGRARAPARDGSRRRVLASTHGVRSPPSPVDYWR
jgi:hypothetical protein